MVVDDDGDVVAGVDAVFVHGSGVDALEFGELCGEVCLGHAPVVDDGAVGLLECRVLVEVAGVAVVAAAGEEDCGE